MEQFEQKVICKFCEKLYNAEQTYNLEDENCKDSNGIMCIDCVVETYYYLELS